MVHARISWTASINDKLTISPEINGQRAILYRATWGSGQNERAFVLSSLLRNLWRLKGSTKDQEDQ